MDKALVTQEEALLVSHFSRKFKESMVAKASYTKAWNAYYDAYKGDYFKQKGIPDYKSNAVSNYIFSIVETIRPIMVDNDPKWQVMPRSVEGMSYAEDITKVFAYEWDREKMNKKLYKELINTLVTGNAFFFVPYDSEAKEIKAIPVSPFNIFPDPLAKNIDEAEYIIYANYFNVEVLKRNFPDKIGALVGGSINYKELVGDVETANNEDNQVLILEVHSRDHSTGFDAQGNPEIKYPKGRVTIVAPDLGIVLDDKKNPYTDGKFPFVHIKDYDIPDQFWGEGEVSQLLSPQTTMNELNNAIIDNAKTTANMPWIVDKNAGVAQGSITSRPGLIIRKNQGSTVDRLQAPNMPSYVINAVNEAKGDMEQISGIFDTLKGNSETGVYTAQGILALQEAGQARIRLKVKLLEDSLGDLASLWYSRMGQFWKDDRFIRISKSDGTYDFKKLMVANLKHDYDVRILAGSTMALNRNAMLDLMIRLAQTQMSDGQALVDREAVMEYLPPEVKNAVLRRTKENVNAFEAQLQELTQVVQQQAQQSQQFQQEITQTIQQLTQETKQNDQQTFKVIENITKTLETINGKIVKLEQYTQEKDQALEKEQADGEAYDNAYNEGYRKAETELKNLENEPLGDGLPESQATDVGDGLPKEADLELPSELLEGLESLSDDELALLQASDPTVNDLI